MVAYRSDAENHVTTTSMAINKPAGTADGDILIAVIRHDLNEAITKPAGWTTLQDAWYATSNIRVGVYWKLAASEGASWTWSWATGFPQSSSGVVTAFSGGDSLNPVLNFVSVEDTTSDAFLDTPTTTPTYGGLALACAVGNANGTSASSVNNGFTLRNSGSTPGTGMMTATKAAAAGAATGATRFTTPNSNQMGDGIQLVVNDVIPPTGYSMVI